ncbi:MAG: TonB-dependent receptor plug domain-containing protein, partial [Acidobacteriota bacterium]
MKQQIDPSTAPWLSLLTCLFSVVLIAPLAALADDAQVPADGAVQSDSRDSQQKVEASESEAGSDSAEDDEAEDAVEDEIVVLGKYLYADQVNALRTPTPIIDVPQSLSIATADQFAEQGFTSIGEIVNYTPGVNTSQGEGHRDAIVFRGVRSTADFFIDGVRDDVQYYRPLYNLEQVEILRGPNALLFGRGGTGGILNRVTKKGLIGQSFSSYQLGFDSFGEVGV